MSFCSFLFGEVSVEVGGLIGDLLFFGLVLEGDFSVTHLIGFVVGDSSTLYSWSVLPVEVWVRAGVCYKICLCSWCLWNFVGINWGSYFIDIVFLVTWLQLTQFFFYYPLVVILCFIALDGLKVGCGLRSYYHFLRFVVWDVIPVV